MTKWKIHLVGKKRPRFIDADYYRIEDGTVRFRNSNPTGYPVPVATFAHGQWVSIELANAAERAA